MLTADSVQEFYGYLSAALFDVVVQEQGVPTPIPKHGVPERIVVGFSGGLDSTVLLHALKTLNLPSHVAAVHVNHGLSADADQWESHCQLVASAMNIPVLIKKYWVVDKGDGIESAARSARYCAFEESIDDTSCLLTAHHRDDQVETLFFRLMRGAGVTGLAGIPPLRSLGSGWLLRPLLKVRRSQIEGYAAANNLSWVEDDSNCQHDFDRNFIRHNIIPILASRWPAMPKKVAQTVLLMTDTRDLLADYARQDLDFCQRQAARIGESICIDRYMTLSPARRKHIIRQWVTSQQWPAPSQAHLAELESMLKAKPDSAPLLQLTQYQFRRYRSRLYLLPPLPDLDRSHEYVWHSREPLSLADGSTLSIGNSEQADIKPMVFHVRFRQGGERCQPCDRDRSQTLKKLLQEYDVEPWLRNVAPLIYLNNKLIAVADLFICQHENKPLTHAIFFWQYNGSQI